MQRRLLIRQHEHFWSFDATDKLDPGCWITCESARSKKARLLSMKGSQYSFGTTTLPAGCSLSENWD